MSETTPDPADVHTGTDRVELTDAEFIPLCGTAGLRFWQSPEATRLREGIDRLVADKTAQLRKAYDTVNTENEESAARVQALTAELRKVTEGEPWLADLVAARAELAAANARCAELEEEVMAHQVSDGYTKGYEHGTLTTAKFKAELDALQATLDRVTAAIKSSKHKTTDHEGTVTGYLISDADLRAALTPEGKR